MKKLLFIWLIIMCIATQAYAQNKIVIPSEDGGQIVILRGFIVNYLEEKVSIYIERSTEKTNFNLDSAELMGKGGYLFTPPNVSEVFLRTGEYRVTIITESGNTEKFIIEITKDMKVPFTLEIEE